MNTSSTISSTTASSSTASFEKHQEHIKQAFEAPSEEKASSHLLEVLGEVIAALEAGDVSIVEPDAQQENGWRVNVWVKQAILLCFRHAVVQEVSDGVAHWRDRISLRRSALVNGQGGRIVPGAWVREGVFLGNATIVMPAFINIGAHIREGTMIDSCASVGCCYIGEKCHISANVTIGGVLEPLQASPVIIEKGCFIGAGSHVVEGVHLGESCVLGAGVILGSRTKIVDRASGEISYGKIPPYAVVVPGSIACSENPSLALNCAVIAKTVTPQTRQKTAITDLLRL